MKIDDLNTLKVGDIVYLSDEKTLAAVKSTKPVENEVKNIFVATFGKSSVKFYELLDEKELSTFLVMTKIDEDYSLKLSFHINEFTQGIDRQEALEAGYYWLFCKPDNEDNFVAADLELTYEIFNADSEYIKGTTLYGEFTENNSVEPCSFTNWDTKSDIEYPQLSILEIGGLDENGNKMPEGPAMFFYQSYPIKNSDLEILNK